MKTIKKIILPSLLIMLLLMSACGKNISKTDKSQTPSDESTSSELPGPEQKLADELILALKGKSPSKLSLFYVGDKQSFIGYEPLETVKRYEYLSPFEEITDSEKVAEFTKKLRPDTWRASEYQAKIAHVMLIYFDSTFHINLEEHREGESFISINSPLGIAYYLVPDNVYSKVLEYYDAK